MNNLVLVTGPPGAGKTTLAAPLAALLGFQLITKDSIKEALDDAVSPAVRDLDWSHAVGRATYEVMWALAPHFNSLVLECNFYPHNADHRSKLRELASHSVEVFCRCPAEVARERYLRRAGMRHPVHVETDLPLRRFEDWDAPMGIGPVIIVDTTHSVDIEQLAEQVRTTLTESTRSARKTNPAP